MKKLLLFIVAALLAVQMPAKNHNGVARGTVTDGNGPVSGVYVSDGVSIARTGNDGRFSIKTDPESRFVFVITPSGYISTTLGGKDCFYQEIKENRKEYNFTLCANPLDDNHHKLVVVADPQISDSDDLRPLKDRLEDIGKITDGITDTYTFGINLGDMVGWNHSLYPRINKIFERSNIVWRNVMGNHDMTNYGRSYESSHKDFENAYGPTYYSFNVGRVHYVVLNDNFFVGKDWYYIGYLDERQLSWLEKDLGTIEKGSELVVCMHIPTCLYKHDIKEFSYPDISEQLCNNTALYAMLEPFNTTILTGHMHTNSNVRISDNIIEHNIGGLCGAWWCGDVCIDGCPPGCKVYDRNGRALSWYYKGEGLPSDCQMKIYVDSPDYPGEVVAHIWDQDEYWKVEYFEDGSKVCDMQNFEGTDPHAKEIFTDISGYKISWLAYFPSPNFFRATINPAATRHEVRVTDRFGKVHSEEF